MKIVINKKDVYIEHEIANIGPEMDMQEFDNFMGMVHDILNNFHQEAVVQDNTTAIKQPEPEMEPQKPVEYASPAQRKLMKTYGIQFTDQTTKWEAVAMINAYKRDHGIPVNENFKNY